MSTKGLIGIIIGVGVIATIMIVEYFPLEELWWPLMFVPAVVGIILLVLLLKRRNGGGGA